MRIFKTSQKREETSKAKNIREGMEGQGK